MGAKDVSETAREREVFKHYQPPLFAKPAIAPAIPPPQSSHDSSLTAFAQLGALRLNARRALITLCTRDVQYIIAEATRTLSLRSDTVHESDDGLRYGEIPLEKNDGPCSVAIDCFTGLSEAARECLVVEDLSEDVRFKNMGFVTGSPTVKFYAAVPLISPKGLIFGIFSIVDDTPRASISHAEVEFMKDIALTIVNHLEMKRAKQQHKRAERMIRGLGLYVEGKSSLRDWWLNTGHKSDHSNAVQRIRGGQSLEQQADRQFGVQEFHENQAILDEKSPKSSLDGARSTTLQSGLDVINKRAARPQRLRSESATVSTPASDAPETISTAPPEQSSTFTVDSCVSNSKPARVVRQNSTAYSIDSNEHASGTLLQEAVLSTELKESFSRASNLIREGMSVDGALFLDASVGTFGGGSSMHEIGNHAPSARIDRANPIFTSSSDDAFPSTEPTQASSEKSCGILGFSTSSLSSLKMHEASQTHLSVTESFLRKLLRRYPHGKVFNFDEGGTLSSTEDELRKALTDVHVDEEGLGSRSTGVQDRKRKKRKMSRETEGNEILRILPGARCVAFFPLWDPTKERWFSGSFAWTNNPTRVLDPDEDLTYLASFGNSIMAEVSRLSALVSSQMKDSFVSSISHELRSPLHGILASAELLQESVLSIYEQEVVEMINSCGRTLLDIINHVLDFSKVKIAKEEKGQKRKSRVERKANTLPSSSHIQGTPGVDLCHLTEEIMEVVYTGSSYTRRSSISGHNGPSFPRDHIHREQPLIIVQMQFRSDWNLILDPGAWRRLVMNIFANALKYTETGFVHIEIGSRHHLDSSEQVTLTVTDSGKGMSPEFLTHHLYTPFAQENSLAVGSGLGLSIVRHIVDELGGSIHINSEQNSGTEVTVRLPLIQVSPSRPLSEDGDDISAARKRLHGLEACLVGFDVFPDLVDEPTGILSTQAKRMFHFKDAMTATLRDWFGMKVLVASTLNVPTCRVFCIMESTLKEMVAAGSLKLVSQPKDAKPLVLVFCTMPHTPQSTLTLDAFDVVYIQQPIGPRKLAKALDRCLVEPGDAKASNFTTSNLSSVPLAIRPPIRPTLNSNGSRGSAETVVLTTQPVTSQPPKFMGSPESSLRHDNTSANVGAHAVFAKASSPLFVLLVEDNAINLKLLVTCLTKMGIDHVTAENGLIALQTYQASSRLFELVFMDISMPIMDGLQASRKIRAFEESSQRSKVPIVAITGAASDAIRQEAFSAGIDQCLTKPVSLKVLRELLEEYTPR